MDNRIKFQDFLATLIDIQDMMKKENLERVANSPDEEWDLILSLEITPTNFVIKSEETIMEFSGDKKGQARIKRRKRR